MMKINQSIFIKNIVIEKELIDYKSNIIPIKSGLTIKIHDLDN